VQMDTHKMKNHTRADGGVRGITETTVAAVDPLRPALASIRAACSYLGEPSRAKFYADILPHLDIVKFGARTFVTIGSLDRVIAANMRPAAELSGVGGGGEPNAAANSMSRSNTATTGDKGHKLEGRTRAPRAVSVVGGCR
jgi:hypothetical protein